MEEEFLTKIGVGVRPIDDPFFEDSYNSCKIFERKGVTVEDEEELCHEVMKEFSCHAAGCKATFQTLVDFEMHYNSLHRYVCTVCKKNLPNSRLLDIHTQEIHDSFFQVSSLKKPMYQCFLSECDLKFSNVSERMDHCISVHEFPKSFRYSNVSYRVKDEAKDKMEIDECQSGKKESRAKKVLLNRNQRYKMFTAVDTSTIAVNSNVPQKPSCSTNTILGTSSLVFIPRQVQKSYTNALTNNQSNEKDVLESGCMMDLAESLPE